MMNPGMGQIPGILFYGNGSRSQTIPGGTTAPPPAINDNWNFSAVNVFNTHNSIINIFYPPYYNHGSQVPPQPPAAAAPPPPQIGNPVIPGFRTSPPYQLRDFPLNLDDIFMESPNPFNPAEVVSVPPPPPPSPASQPPVAQPSVPLPPQIGGGRSPSPSRSTASLPASSGVVGRPLGRIRGIHRKLPQWDITTRSQIKSRKN